jgi:hypothetical protein
MPHRLIVGHKNLATAEPKQRRTLAAVPCHGDSTHDDEVHRTYGEYGVLNLLTVMH